MLDRDRNTSIEQPLLTLKVVEGNGETTLTLGAPASTFPTIRPESDIRRVARLVPHFGSVINVHHRFILLKSQ